MSNIIITIIINKCCTLQSSKLFVFFKQFKVKFYLRSKNSRQINVPYVGVDMPMNQYKMVISVFLFNSNQNLFIVMFYAYNQSLSISLTVNKTSQLMMYCFFAGCVRDIRQPSRYNIDHRRIMKQQFITIEKKQQFITILYRLNALCWATVTYQVTLESYINQLQLLWQLRFCFSCL